MRRDEMDRKKEYEQPQVEVVEFELSDGIASSADFGGGAIGTEGLFE
jgi:hypothetical protein